MDMVFKIELLVFVNFFVFGVGFNEYLECSCFLRLFVEYLDDVLGEFY